MFLTKNDLGTTMYGYKMDQITEGDDTILSIAMAAAEEEVRNYFSINNKLEWYDGCLRYDVNAILAAKGKNRNALIVKHVVVIAKWWVVDLTNADIIYKQAKERYGRSVSWLKILAKGDIYLDALPTLRENQENSENTPQLFSFGSRLEFNHE